MSALDTVRLDPDQLQELGEIIAHELRGAAPGPAGRSLTAAQLADHLEVDVKTVYRHADELGAKRIGRGLRFDPAVASAAWPPEPSHGEPRRAPTPRRAAASTTELLPIGRKS